MCNSLTHTHPYIHTPKYIHAVGVKASFPSATSRLTWLQEYISKPPVKSENISNQQTNKKNNNKCNK